MYEPLHFIVYMQKITNYNMPVSSDFCRAIEKDLEMYVCDRIIKDFTWLTHLCAIKSRKALFVHF